MVVFLGFSHHLHGKNNHQTYGSYGDVIDKQWLVDD
jgi:hypothetical protein